MKRILPIFALFIIFITLTGCIQQTTVKNRAEIIIKPSLSENLYLKDDRTIGFPVFVSYSNELYSYTDPVINFSFQIKPPVGSKTSDFDYLLFKAHDFDNRMFKHSNGIYQLVWEDSDNNTFLINGEKRFYMDDIYTLQLTLKFDQDSLENFGDSDVYITFYYPDETWSDTFKISTQKIKY